MLKALLAASAFLLCGSLPATAVELSVFAASSLTEAMTAVAERYQRQHPEDRIQLNFAGSQTLAMQIEQGAPAELFISASRNVMSRVSKSGLVAEIQPLLGNRLVVATRSDLQPPLKSMHDLTRPGLLLVIGNPQVPVGAYTRQLLTNLAASPAHGTTLVSRIKDNIVSEEGRVKAIIAKLLLGEADAGIAYQSDLKNSKLRSVEIPEHLNPRASYLLAKVRQTTNRSARFYAFLSSTEATEIFRSYGFLAGDEQ